MEFPFASARRRVAALVRPDARASAADRARPGVFILAQLAALALLAALAPPYLAAVGADPRWAFGPLAGLLSLAAAYAGVRLFVAGRARLRRRADLAGERYAALAGAIGDLVMRHDRSGGALAVSGDAEALFGHDAASLIGRGFFNLVHVGDRPAYLDALDRAARYGSATATVRLRVGAGEREPQFRWIEVRARRIDGDGDGASTVAVVRDVNAAKTAEDRLLAARAESELANAWKDRLLANVSHELRTPLNAILGFSEILGDPELSPRDPAKQRDYAKIIHASADHLLSMVNLILDTSKIAAGTFRILPEPFALAPMIADCCDMVRLKATAGGVALELAPIAELDELVADKRACRQILLNLLANAVKFTRRGGRVVVGASSHGEMIHICVADNGVGIPAESLSRLGDPFFQVRNDYDRNFEGAGLGLSLVRGLVGLHGGALKVESVAGVGTRVTVRLPRVPRPDAATGAPAPLETEASLSGGVDASSAAKEKRIA